MDALFASPARLTVTLGAVLPSPGEVANLDGAIASGCHGRKCVRKTALKQVDTATWLLGEGRGDEGNRGLRFVAVDSGRG
jgi:hypothetical protein